jgi:hypothetical protein
MSTKTDNRGVFFIYMLLFGEIYKTVSICSYRYFMGGRRRRTLVKPQRKTRTTQGRCPKCTTIVKFNVSGPVGKEIYECTSCLSKYPIDQL